MERLTTGDTPGIGEGVPLTSSAFWNMEWSGVSRIGSGCWIVTCKGWVNKAGGLLRSRDTDLEKMRIRIV